MYTKNKVETEKFFNVHSFSTFLFLTNYLKFKALKIRPKDIQHLPAEGIYPTLPALFLPPPLRDTLTLQPSITTDNCITDPHFIFRPDSIVTLIKF